MKRTVTLCKYDTLTPKSLILTKSMFDFKVRTVTAAPPLNLIRSRLGSKTKLPRIITTGSVHCIFFLSPGRGSSFSHFLLTQIVYQAQR